MREFWVESGGVRLFATDEGSGPVLIMLHGGMANHLAARPLVAPLGGQYRIVKPDLRGSDTSGPASFLVVDPDGNQILLDQHV